MPRSPSDASAGAGAPSVRRVGADGLADGLGQDGVGQDGPGREQRGGDPDRGGAEQPAGQDVGRPGVRAVELAPGHEPGQQQTGRDAEQPPGPTAEEEDAGHGEAAPQRDRPGGADGGERAVEDREPEQHGRRRPHAGEGQCEELDQRGGGDRDGEEHRAEQRASRAAPQGDHGRDGEDGDQDRGGQSAREVGESRGVVAEQVVAHDEVQPVVPVALQHRAGDDDEEGERTGRQHRPRPRHAAYGRPRLDPRTRRSCDGRRRSGCGGRATVQGRQERRVTHG